MHALEKLPADRFATAADFALALRDGMDACTRRVRNPSHRANIEPEARPHGGHQRAVRSRRSIARTVRCAVLATGCI